MYSKPVILKTSGDAGDAGEILRKDSEAGDAVQS